MKLTIPFALPGLNDYIAAERSHRQKAAGVKRQNQQAVMMVLKRQLGGHKFCEPVVMHYTWTEKDRRRDKDNVSAFGRKVIQDALVELGALRNDGWSNISCFTDQFRVNTKQPCIQIEIEENQA